MDSTCIKFCVVLQFLLNMFVNNIMFWVFCAMTTYSPRGGYQHCGGTCCLHYRGIAVLNFIKQFCFCKIWDFFTVVFSRIMVIWNVMLLCWVSGWWYFTGMCRHDLEPFKMEVTVSFKISDTTHPVMQCHITDDMYASMAQEIQLSTYMKWVSFLSVWADTQWSHLYYSHLRFLHF